MAFIWCDGEKYRYKMNQNIWSSVGIRVDSHALLLRETGSTWGKCEYFSLRTRWGSRPFNLRGTWLTLKAPHLRAATMKVNYFWGMTPWSPVDYYRLFGRKYFHLKGRIILFCFEGRGSMSGYWTCCLLHFSYLLTSTLKMEAECSCERLNELILDYAASYPGRD
jgi:hypothetical protein